MVPKHVLRMCELFMYPCQPIIYIISPVCPQFFGYKDLCKINCSFQNGCPCFSPQNIPSPPPSVAPSGDAVANTETR